MKSLGCLFVLLSSLPCVAEPIDFADFNLIDLSHSFGTDTIYWPTASAGFELQRESFGISDGGYFYAANSFSTPEHGGTHIDAPIHFSEHGWSLDEIPVDRFLGPAIVIDVSDQVKADQDYRLTVSKVIEFEKIHPCELRNCLRRSTTPHPNRYWNGYRESGSHRGENQEHADRTSRSRNYAPRKSDAWAAACDACPRSD